MRESGPYILLWWLLCWLGGRGAWPYIEVWWCPGRCDVPSVLGWWSAGKTPAGSLQQTWGCRCGEGAGHVGSREVRGMRNFFYNQNVEQPVLVEMCIYSLMLNEGLRRDQFITGLKTKKTSGLKSLSDRNLIATKGKDRCLECFLTPP